jgi:NADP-dependent 3-hydroxy acid dehydrogenase YdfG
MTCKLADKVALVTGGSAGIGLGIANALLKEARAFLLPAAVSPNWIRQLPRSATMPQRSRAIAPSSRTSTASTQLSRHKPGASMY